MVRAPYHTCCIISNSAWPSYPCFLTNQDSSCVADVVADMLNRGSYREAIGVILAFDLQEAFPLDGVLSYIVDKVVRNRKEQESEVECDLAGSVCLSFFHAFSLSLLKRELTDVCGQKDLMTDLANSFHCCVDSIAVIDVRYNLEHLHMSRFIR